MDPECMLTGEANIAARLRIKSTSSLGPEKPKLAEWLSIRFEQARRGITSVSCFLDRLSKPHSAFWYSFERAGDIHIKRTRHAMQWQ